MSMAVSTSARPRWRLSGILAVIVSAPVQASAALLVLVTLGRPVLFRQMRIGLGGERFELIKLRTMVEPRPGQSRFTSDVERTPAAGHLLRSLRLDELPTLVNVARGEMTWIGPRPLPPEIHACLPDEYHARIGVRPGLTGVAQTMHGRAAPLSERLRADCRYAATKGWRSDLVIALRTPRRLFTHSSVQDLAEVDDIGLAECLAAGEEADGDAPAR